MSNAPEFRTAVEAWLLGSPTIRSAVLFGSGARAETREMPADVWSDWDYHIVTVDAPALERVDWARALPGYGFRFQCVRPATGGVRKVTAIFGGGQIDLILVPERKLQAMRRGVGLGRHRQYGPLSTAVSEMNTCLRSGYRFVKGERTWGAFYRKVATEMEAVRLSDSAARERAAVSVCDALWILQKIERGELAAAQHLLHRSLAETNFALLREWRLRSGEPLPSFGLGRRVEALLPGRQLAWVTVSAQLDRADLRRAVQQALRGLEALMGRLVEGWRVPPAMASLFRSSLSGTRRA